SLVAGAEHDHRLAARRGDDITCIRRDARALRARTEVQRLEMREGRVLAFDVHDGFAPRGDLTVEERAHGDALPGRLPHRRELARELEHLARDGFVVLPSDPWK